MGASPGKFKAKTNTNPGGFGNNEIDRNYKSSLFNYYAKDAPETVRSQTGDVLKCKKSFEPLLLKQSFNSHPVEKLDQWANYVICLWGRNLYIFAPDGEEKDYIELKDWHIRYINSSGKSLYAVSPNNIIKITPTCEQFDLFPLNFGWANSPLGVGRTLDFVFPDCQTRQKKITDILKIEIQESFDSFQVVEFNESTYGLSTISRELYQIFPKFTKLPFSSVSLICVGFLDNFVLQTNDKLLIFSGKTSLELNLPSYTYPNISSKFLKLFPKNSKNYPLLFGLQTDSLLIWRETENLEIKKRGTYKLQKGIFALFSDCCFWNPYIAISTSQGEVFLFSYAESNEVVYPFFSWSAHKYEIDFIKVWQNTWLVTAGTDLEIKIWNKSYECIITSKVKNKVTQMDFCNNYLITGDFHGSVRVMEISSNNIRLLLLARYFCPECPFYKDKLPNDMFKEIISHI